MSPSVPLCETNLALWLMSLLMYVSYLSAKITMAPSNLFAGLVVLYEKSVAFSVELQYCGKIFSQFFWLIWILKSQESFKCFKWWFCLIENIYGKVTDLWHRTTSKWKQTYIVHLCLVLGPQIISQQLQLQQREEVVPWPGQTCDQVPTPCPTAPAQHSRCRPHWSRWGDLPVLYMWDKHKHTPVSFTEWWPS